MQSLRSCHGCDFVVCTNLRKAIGMKPLVKRVLETIFNNVFVFRK